MGGAGSESYGSSVVIYPRIKAFQESVYPGLFGLYLQRALTGEEKDRIYSETLARQRINQAANQAAQGLRASLAFQGINPASPLAASMFRGLEQSKAEQFLQAAENAARAVQAGRAGFTEALTRLATAYPPVGQESRSESSGGK